MQINFSTSNMKNYIIIALFIVLIVGYTILQSSDNTADDVTLFTINLVIIPIGLLVIVIAKLVYEYMFVSHSGSIVMPAPQLTEAQKTIIASQPTQKGGKKGGKKRKSFHKTR